MFVVADENAKSKGKKSLKATVAVALMAGAMGVAGNAVAGDLSGEITISNQSERITSSQTVIGDTTINSTAYSAVWIQNHKGGETISSNNGANLTINETYGSYDSWHRVLFLLSTIV